MFCILHYSLFLSRMAIEGQETMVFCRASFRDWSKLPIDLLVDILIRLSDSELVRCKVVCKSWNDTIVNISIPKAFASVHLSELVYTKDVYWIVTHVPHDATRGDIVSSFEHLYRAFPSVPKSRHFRGCCNGYFSYPKLVFFVCTILLPDNGWNFLLVMKLPGIVMFHWLLIQVGPLTSK